MLKSQLLPVTAHSFCDRPSLYPFSTSVAQSRQDAAACRPAEPGRSGQRPADRGSGSPRSHGPGEIEDYASEGITGLEKRPSDRQVADLPPGPHPLPRNAPQASRRAVVVRAEAQDGVDVDKVVKDLQEKASRAPGVRPAAAAPNAAQRLLSAEQAGSAATHAPTQKAAVFLKGCVLAAQAAATIQLLGAARAPAHAAGCRQPCA